MAEKYPGWSPYNFAFSNPIRFTDPDGRAPQDWVGKKNSNGSTTWSWRSDITSSSLATSAGYDSYSKAGKIINTTSGNKVRLGEKGAIHTSVIGAHSNVGPKADFDGGHAWISTSDVEGNLKNTYGLWPDSHPLFAGKDSKGIISDVRTDTEMSYALDSGNYSFHMFLTGDQEKSLNDFIGISDEWGYTHTCADWVSDCFKAATGVRLDVDDYLGAETPRELSKTIIERGANTPQKPTLNENNGSSSSNN